jgi:pyruvate/2-oxoglutarate dehydrogenase complex dihydrolipoamide acyltransferase (E2) component
MRFVAVILPDLGTAPGVPIVVSQWYARRGEGVWEGDRLVELLAGPATFDVPAPTTGRLAAIHRDEDETVEPGATLGLLAVADEAEGEGTDADATGQDPVS